MVYRKEDDGILRHVVDEEQVVEPEIFLPILPTCLINGAKGIGTAYSTFIPNYNPKDICKWLRNRLEGRDLPRIIPWYRGFRGNISIKNKLSKVDETGLDIDELEDYAEDKEESSTVVGVMSRLSMVTSGNMDAVGNKITITELPIGCWTLTYKRFLEQLQEKKEIADHISLSEHDTVHFEIFGYKDTPNAKNLKLTRCYGLTNMKLLNERRMPESFAGAEAILEYFFKWRLPYYQKRKEYLLEKLGKEIEDLDHQVRFLVAVNEKRLILNERPLTEVYADMEKLDIGKYVLDKFKAKSFTKDKADKLRKKYEEKLQEMRMLKERRIEEMWLENLAEFEKEYDKYYGIRKAKIVIEK